MKESQSLRGLALFVGLGRRGRRSGREGTGLWPPAAGDLLGEGEEKQPGDLGGVGVRERGCPVVGRSSLCRVAADRL
ncbi:hypothetical protein HMPREF0262_02974 [Clostridium sp. ATCC 29733]|nr:hypothetical protein HMPREF0262_02974 [Clostridium sp. ATCC 29733]